MDLSSNKPDSISKTCCCGRPDCINDDDDENCDCTSSTDSVVNNDELSLNENLKGQKTKGSKSNYCSAFFNYYIPLLKKEKYKNMPKTEVAKIAGCKWRSMSKEEKEKYHTMAGNATSCNRIRRKRCICHRNKRKRSTSKESCKLILGRSEDATNKPLEKKIRTETELSKEDKAESSVESKSKRKAEIKKEDPDEVSTETIYNRPLTRRRVKLEAIRSKHEPKKENVHSSKTEREIAKNVSSKRKSEEFESSSEKNMAGVTKKKVKFAKKRHTNSDVSPRLTRRGAKVAKRLHKKRLTGKISRQSKNHQKKVQKSYSKYKASKRNPFSRSNRHALIEKKDTPEDDQKSVTPLEIVKPIKKEESPESEQIVKHIKKEVRNEESPGSEIKSNVAPPETQENVAMNTRSAVKKLCKHSKNGATCCEIHSNEDSNNSRVSIKIVKKKSFLEDGSTYSTVRITRRTIKRLPKQNGRNLVENESPHRTYHTMQRKKRYLCLEDEQQDTVHEDCDRSRSNSCHDHGDCTDCPSGCYSHDGSYYENDNGSQYYNDCCPHCTPDESQFCNTDEYNNSYTNSNSQDYKSGTSAISHLYNDSSNSRINSSNKESHTYSNVNYESSDTENLNDTKNNLYSGISSFVTRVFSYPDDKNSKCGEQK